MVCIHQVADFGSARSASSFNDDHLVELLTMPKQHEVAPSDGGMEGPLTRQVCTPCYRAPEVVMSRGGYTSALDMWSVGCIFAELLQRIAYVGSATTPQLQVWWYWGLPVILDHVFLCPCEIRMPFKRVMISCDRLQTISVPVCMNQA